MKRTLFALTLAFGLSLLFIGSALAHARQQTPRDGAWIAFVTGVGNNRHLYRMLADGSEKRRLISGDVTGPTWSPDGRMILFSFLNSENYEFDLYEIAPRGRTAQVMLNTAKDEFMSSWSPDGQWATFFDNQDVVIYRVRHDGSRLAPISKIGDYDPNWSPDGQWIAFTSFRDGNSEIYKMRPDGSDAQRLTNAVSGEYAASWSPDGEWIAFATDRDNNDEIYLMRPDGTDLRRVTDHWATDSDPAWSPDGQWIVFQSNRHQNIELFRTRPDGRDIQRLTFTRENNVSAAFSPLYDLEWQRNGILASGLGCMLVAGFWRKGWGA